MERMELSCTSYLNLLLFNSLLNFYRRSYCLLKIFRAPLCPSSGAQEWLLPVVFRAVVYKLLVWCGGEGYVSGLQDAGLNQQPLYNTLELLMMGIVVPETC